MSIATTSVFLFIGFDNERRRTPGHAWPDLDNLNGFTGLVDHIETMAERLELDWGQEYYLLDCPGVFDYEVTEEMGAWLYRNPCATEDEFSAELERFITEWMKQ